MSFPENYDKETKKYRHLCPECKESFWGRRNQIYHPDCRIWHGNNKAAKLRDKTKLENSLRQENYKKLSEYVTVFGFNERNPIVAFNCFDFNLDYFILEKKDSEAEIYISHNFKIVIEKDQDVKEYVTVFDLK